MFDKSLFKPAGFCQNFLGCINNPILQTQKQIEVSQTEIRIKNRRALTQLGQSNAEIGGESGFANPTFS